MFAVELDSFGGRMRNESLGAEMEDGWRGSEMWSCGASGVGFEEVGVCVN